MNAVAKSYAFIDQQMAALAKRAADQGEPVRCSAGCFHCCKEMVWAERREVQYMVDRVPPAELPELRAKTQAWWIGYFANGFERMPHPNEMIGHTWLLRFRAAGLWCPLLKNGLCSAYAGRPASCRVHVVTGDPALCADDLRRPTQRFAIATNRDDMLLYAMNIYTEDEALPLLQFDQLGIWLGHLLLGKTERSESATDVQMVAEEGAAP